VSQAELEAQAFSRRRALLGAHRVGVNGPDSAKMPRYGFGDRVLHHARPSQRSRGHLSVRTIVCAARQINGYAECRKGGTNGQDRRRHLGRLQSVGATALGAPEARAGEVDNERPLFIDPYAQMFADAAAARGLVAAVRRGPCAPDCSRRIRRRCGECGPNGGIRAIIRMFYSLPEGRSCASRSCYARPVGCASAMVLLGALVWVLLVVLAPPAQARQTLTLAPEQGGPGKLVTATTTGFGACLDSPQKMSLQWDDRWLSASNPRIVNRDFGSLAADFTVPDDASTGKHTVTALCEHVPPASATFTVVPTEKPTLTLDTGKGPRGSQVTASGTGFACGAGQVQLLWDGNSLLAEGPSGTFKVGLTVPSDASIGGHSVVASCRNHPDITDRQSFTVTSSETTPVTEPALVLQPTSGPPGGEVHVTGERFACASHSRAVELSWDDGTQLASASLDASGRFDTSVSVPADAAAGRHTVRAACSDGSASAPTDFTVVVKIGDGSPPPPPPRNAWWVIALMAGVALLVLAYFLSRRRGRHGRLDTRVHAVSRPGAPLVVTVRETPAPGEATHVVRLEPHPDTGTQTIRDIGTQTIREVDDDHGRGPE